MARRPVQVRDASVKTVRDVRVPGARQLVTTTPNAYGEVVPIARGAIVRLRVQHGDAEVDVERARVELAAVADKVIVQRPARAKVGKDETSRIETTSITTREAVLGLVEASACHDKARLQALVERIMSEAAI